MTDPRKLREAGSVLTLGGIQYRIEGVEGRGSSAVVYQAAYEDALSGGSYHRVLIKELFPLTRDGSIYRGETGEILCTQEGREGLEFSKERFLTGNRVNLELLLRAPAGTSGNLNSYPAYGTCYSVLSLHGGVSLKQMLVEEGKTFTAAEAAAAMMRILSALEVFHSQGLLHLDISPDNILMLPEQAMLIDYNSVWDMTNGGAEDFTFSEKQGYSPPEVTMGDFRSIGYASDLFSACAVFFHLLTGRALTQKDLVGNGLRRSLAGDLGKSWFIPQTAAAKAAQILLKGLHTLPRKRYQNVEALREDIQELQRRLEGKGVSLSALWESSHGALQRRKADQEEYLPQPVTLKNGEILTQKQLLAALAEGECFLLTGSGGMGKTRALTEIWKKCCLKWQEGAPAAVYLPLKDHQQSAGEAGFLRRSILRGLRFSQQEEGYADGLHHLEQILEKKGSVILLLDGLNEAGRRQEKLLLEIEDLSKKAGVGILLTDRSEGVLSYGLAGFRSAALSPLGENQRNARLEQAGLTAPDGMEELLSNPMMLFLYIDAIAAGGTSAEIPDRPEKLIRLYLENFCRRALRSASGDPGRQLLIRYLMEHLLPQIALGMQRSKKTVLTAEELGAISDRSFRMLTHRAFQRAFQEYRGKSRILLSGIASPEEWYDLAVMECLVDQFGLLQQTVSGYFSLLHDNFQQTLAEMAEEKEKRLRAEKKRILLRRLPVLLCAAVLAAGLVWGTVKYLPTLGKAPAVHYTEEETYVIREGTNCLITSLGKWNVQITAQQELLEEADSLEILDNRSDQQKEFLAQKIDQKEAYLRAYPATALPESHYEKLLALAEQKTLFSPELLAALCSRQQALEEETFACLSYLETRLCHPDSRYIPLGDQEEMVKAYGAYLEAEQTYVSCLLAQLLSQMTPEQKADILTAMESMKALDGFSTGAGSTAPELLEMSLQSAQRRLGEARGNLIACGFPLE